ncbi:MAG: DNA polymerase III subunit delta, partial [Clostridia bacterium]|nr:DNA polymerase III subunit delta [Clostridia bacterium]
IFDEKEIDKRSALYKKVSKLGVDVEFEYLNETDLVTWVEREVLSEHKKIDKSVAQYFVSICDEGMANIKNELEKLISYCGETITKTDVDKIVSKAVGVRIFELTDCIMAKNVNGALTILRDLKTVKEPAFKVLYLLSSTFDKMLKCALLMAEGNNYNDIAQKVGLAPFIVRKYTDSARGFGENYLMDRIIEAAEIDFSIKSGEVSDWDALEKYVLDSCEMVM